MRIVILTGQEFNNALYHHDETRFKVVDKDDWRELGNKLKSRYIIFEEVKTGDFFMGFEAMRQETDDIWSQVINTPDKKYTMRQCQRTDEGWREMEPVRHG